MPESARPVIVFILIIAAYVAVRLAWMKMFPEIPDKPPSALMKRLKSVFWGLVFIAGGFWFWLYLVGNPINELALINRGVTAKGVITDVREDVIEPCRQPRQSVEI